jgi:hypothetical protein
VDPIAFYTRLLCSSTTLDNSGKRYINSGTGVIFLLVRSFSSIVHSMCCIPTYVIEERNESLVFVSRKKMELKLWSGWFNTNGYFLHFIILVVVLLQIWTRSWQELQIEAICNSCFEYVLRVNTCMHKHDVCNLYLSIYVLSVSISISISMRLRRWHRFGFIFFSLMSRQCILRYPTLHDATFSRLNVSINYICISE